LTISGEGTNLRGNDGVLSFGLGREVRVSFRKLLLVAAVIAGGAYFYMHSKGAPSTAPSPAVSAAAATPKERMKALATSLGMELTMFMDSGGGNVAFSVRSPVKNTHTSQEFLDAAKRDGIIRDAQVVTSGAAADNFSGAMNDTQFQGSLR
jgi:hypothetical protein